MQLMQSEKAYEEAGDNGQNKRRAEKAGKAFGANVKAGDASKHAAKHGEKDAKHSTAGTAVLSMAKLYESNKADEPESGVNPSTKRRKKKDAKADGDDADSDKEAASVAKRETKDKEKDESKSEAKEEDMTSRSSRSSRTRIGSRGRNRSRSSSEDKSRSIHREHSQVLSMV